MLTGTNRETFKWAIRKFMDSLKAQLKEEGGKEDKTEVNKEVKKERCDHAMDGSGTATWPSNC